MSDPSTARSGWYPDPYDASSLRWWDGARWSEHQHPLVDSHDGAEGFDPYYREPTVDPDVSTNTVWIWLVVLLPLLSLTSIFFTDWRAEVDSVWAEAVEPPASSLSSVFSPYVESLGWMILGWAIIAAVIVFAYLDWRVLRRRGIHRPFHWAWVFFAVILTNGVYVIGRGVVLRRRTGRGLGPVWAWIAVAAVTLITYGIYFAVTISYLFETMPDLSEFSRS